MKNLLILAQKFQNRWSNAMIFTLMVLLILLAVPYGLAWLDQSAAFFDLGVVQLLLLTMLSLLSLTHLSWWILTRYWNKLGLPSLQMMVSQFNNLTLWQQFVIYWASFALLLLAGIFSLLAIF